MDRSYGHWGFSLYNTYKRRDASKHDERLQIKVIIGIATNVHMLHSTWIGFNDSSKLTLQFIL